MLLPPVVPRAAELYRRPGAGQGESRQAQRRNFLITSVIEALGESFALVRKAGIDCAQFLDVVTSTLFDAHVYKTYGGLIAEERYHPAGFKAELGYKDIRPAITAAEALKFRCLLPVSSPHGCSH